MLRRPLGLVVKHRPWFLQSSIFTREVLLRVGLFDEDLAIAEDLDIITRVALEGPFTICRKELVEIYRRKESLESLGTRGMRKGYYRYGAYERVYTNLLRHPELTWIERATVWRALNKNQRSLGNALVIAGNKLQARNAFQKAIFPYLSIRAIIKYFGTFLPQGASVFLVRKRGPAVLELGEPGDLAVDSKGFPLLSTKSPRYKGRAVTTPRILYLTTNNPCGKAYGGQMRALHIGRALSRIGRVTLVLAPDGDMTLSDTEAARAEFHDVKVLRLFTTLERGSFQHIRRHLSLGISGSFGLSCSMDVKREFSQWALENDLIWAFGLRIPSALELDGKIPTFIDIDDVRSQLLLSEALNQTNWINRVKLRAQARMWRLRETRLPGVFEGIGVCSEADRVYLGAHPSVHVIPNGFQRPDGVPQRHPASPPRIGFIGTFDYVPNADGMRWFTKHVWPRIKEQCPTARLRLVGSGTDRGIIDLGQDMDGLGYLEDPATEIASWSAMVIPIFVGAGTRVKISEGFSRQCPIVSTSLGAYGYDVRDGIELLLADSTQVFADKCLRVINQPSEAAEMAARAWKVFLERFTWETIAPKVWAAVDDCLRRQPVP